MLYLEWLILAKCYAPPPKNVNPLKSDNYSDFFQKDPLTMLLGFF
jgi:hypothetical protein